MLIGRREKRDRGYKGGLNIEKERIFFWINLGSLGSDSPSVFGTTSHPVSLQRQRERDIEQERQRQRDTERETEREKDRDRQTETDRQTERQTERDREIDR